MRLPLVVTILTAISSVASCAKAQELPAAQDGWTKSAQLSQMIVLTEAQAVEFAEKFIERNGYTDLPPDKDNLAYESIERKSDVDEMLKMRYDTLERQAFGISRGRKGIPDSGWTVVFRYKNSSDQTTSKIGRAVTMNFDGSAARVEHVDFILAKVDKKL